MVVLKEHSLCLLAQLDVVFGLVLHLQVDDFDLVSPHSIEVLHLNQKLFRNIGSEKVIYQVPKVEVVLNLFCRNHPIIISLTDVFVFVVDEAQGCRVVLALGSRVWRVVDWIIELILFISYRKQFLI